MAEKHYLEQQKHTRDYLLPFFKESIQEFAGKHILEVGCAEGGGMDVLSLEGFDVVGLELEADRVAIAQKKNPDLNIRVGDVSDPNLPQTLKKQFDLIIMRDVIEHVPDRENTFLNIRQLLTPGGYLYITFPPRFSPFAGHQQHGRTLMGKTPWLHLLPSFILRGASKLLNENPEVIESVLLNYRIGLSIRAFWKGMKKTDLIPNRQDYFLIRPAFQTRYGLKPRKLWNIPVFREFFCMGCECLLQKPGDAES